MGGRNGRVGHRSLNGHLSGIVAVSKDHIEGITLNGSQDCSIWTNPLSNSRSTRTRQTEQLGNPSIRAALQDGIIGNATNSTTSVESSTYVSQCHGSHVWHIQGLNDGYLLSNSKHYEINSHQHCEVEEPRSKQNTSSTISL